MVVDITNIMDNMEDMVIMVIMDIREEKKWRWTVEVHITHITLNHPHTSPERNSICMIPSRPCPLSASASSAR